MIEFSYPTVGLARCDQRTIGSDPAAVLKRGHRLGILESGRADDGQRGHRRHATPSVGPSGIGFGHKPWAAASASARLPTCAPGAPLSSEDGTRTGRPGP
jgi:hypothetical protein